MFLLYDNDKLFKKTKTRLSRISTVGENITAEHKTPVRIVARKSKHANMISRMVQAVLMTINCCGLWN